MEQHRDRAEGLEQDAERLEDKSERLGRDIKQARKDFEDKRESGDVPVSVRREDEQAAAGPEAEGEAGPADPGDDE